MMRGERSLSSCHTGSPCLLPRLLLTPTGVADSRRGFLCEVSASGAMTVNEAPSLHYLGPTITWALLPLARDWRSPGRRGQAM